MKPLDLHAIAKANAAAGNASGKPPVAYHAGAELQQRLWQLLLPLSLPEVATESSRAALVAGAAVSGSQSQNHGSKHDDQERDPSSEISTAAYLLASAVQQLSRLYSADGTQQTALQERSGEHSFNVRLETSDADSGTALVDVWNPELGDVGLEVEWSNGAVRVTATADSVQSARVLQEGQALLAERLLRQGVALEALDVIVRKRPGKPAARARNRGRESSAHEGNDSKRENEP